MADLRDVALRVITDSEFAASLLADPESTLRAEGVEPTAEMLDALRGIDAADLRELAQDFQKKGAVA